METWYMRLTIVNQEGGQTAMAMYPNGLYAILANMALDGMQKVLSDRFHTNRLGKVDLRFKNAHILSSI